MKKGVTHCRECIHWTKRNGICREWSRFGTMTTPAYGYCHKAEKRRQSHVYNITERNKH